MRGLSLWTNSCLNPITKIHTKGESTMSNAHIIRCKRLHPDAKLFAYSRERDACMDVYALHDFEIPAFPGTGAWVS